MVARVLKRSAHYSVLGLILVVMVFPLLWMFRVALLPSGSSLSLSSLFAGVITLANFSDLFQFNRMGLFLFNSIFVGLVVTLSNILFCFMVAYALSRYRMIANKIVFGSIVGVLMIPAHIIIIPLYLICLKSGIYDSYFALILPWLVNPIGVFLVKQYLESLPPTLEEAARVDGASEMTIIFRIVMPLCKPALSVLAIQVFFTNWNSFMFPYILTQSESVRTLPVALALFQGHQAIDWQHLMAGSTLAVIPILLIFLIMQRQIVSGITAGAVKQ
ncbi:MAG: carbohydrate ABC transporter permease [bacterium]|nr:carbohydrate ABC transporter permease [bacterium]